ncbi:MAG: hypothetical protein AAF491_11510 [Verrucomicrobiota bacterium]
MRWIVFVGCLLLVPFAKGSDLPKELRALEFGLEVESVEADTPLLELQWKYQQHLLDLETQFSTSSSEGAVSAVKAELENLASPLQTPVSTIPDLKRLQEAHRARFAVLLNERAEALTTVIGHYQAEARKQAEVWKSEGKLAEATLALETSARFSSLLDRPIEYETFLEKKIAEEGVQESRKPSGPLRAWGVVAERIPIDISIANPFDDFVAVEFHNRYWAAIRENGEVVSSQPDLNGLQNVAQIAMNDRRAYVLFRDGKVGSFPPDKDIPSNLEDVTKIVVAHQDVLALTRGGWIKGWGKTLSTSQLRPPETLIDVVDIALTWGSQELQGFALRSNGTVSTWGGGEKPILLPDDLPKIATLDAGWTKLACLTEDGGAIVLDHRGYSRGGLPPDSTQLNRIMLRGPLVAARTEEGTWSSWGNSTMGVSDQIKALEGTETITYKLNAHEKGWGALLWIDHP